MFQCTCKLFAAFCFVAVCQQAAYSRCQQLTLEITKQVKIQLMLETLLPPLSLDAVG